MNPRKTVKQMLEAKGYAVDVRNPAADWLCSIEWHGQVRTFLGSTEQRAIGRAAQYVGELEAETGASLL